MEEKLYCCFCFNLFEDPRILPCLHSICFKCIRLTSKGEEAFLNCPRCFSLASFSSADIDKLITTLPSNIRVKKAILQETFLKKLVGVANSVCDSCDKCTALYYCSDCKDFLCDGCWKAHQVLKKSRSHSSISISEAKKMDRTQLIELIPLPSSTSSSAVCQYHGKLLDKQCETCDVPVCERCVLQIHTNHDIMDSGQDAVVAKEEIQHSIEEFEKSLKKASAMLCNLKSYQQLFMVEKEAAVNEISKIFEGIRSVIDKKERSLLDHCNQDVADSSKCLIDHARTVQDITEKLKEGVSFASEAIADFADDEVVGLDGLISERHQMLEGQLNDLSLTTRKPTIKFHAMERFKVSLVKLQGIFEAEEGVEASEGPNANGKELCSTTTTSKETVDQHVEVLSSKSVSLFRSSIVSRSSLVLSPRPRFISSHFSASTRISGINYPIALAFNNVGDIFVTSQSEYISVFRKQQNSLVYKEERIGGRGTGKLEFLSPSGIAIHGEMVYVTECDGNRVHLFTTNGDYRGVIGGKDSLLFCQPRDIKISPTDHKIYVADSGNHCVQVFSKDWTLSHQIRLKDSKEGGSYYRKPTPLGMSFDSIGNIHVLWYHHEPFVSVHDRNGDMLRCYGESFYCNPKGAGIAIDSNNCSFVVGFNVSLRMYIPGSTESQSIHSFNCPRGVTIANNGEVWVADTNNRRLATVNLM